MVFRVSTDVEERCAEMSGVTPEAACCTQMDSKGRNVIKGMRIRSMMGLSDE